MEQKLRILLIGAHPDDCEGCAGGYAALMTQQGHHVGMMSMTDGSLGHFKYPPSELVAIRKAEARKAAELIGAESIILPIQDGHLENNLYTRKMLIRSIRAFNPDLIITHRPNDYHADHRNTSLLVQDASYLLRLPGFCPEAQPLEKTPYILFFHDNFEKPPFDPCVVISIDEVYDTKVRMKACHASQYFEWLPWLDGNLDMVPDDEQGRLTYVRSPLLDGNELANKAIKQSRGEKGQYRITQQYQELLYSRYGNQAKHVVFSEAFEASEYGNTVDEAAIEKLFGCL